MPQQQDAELIRDRFNKAIRYIIAEQLAPDVTTIAHELHMHQPSLSQIAHNKRYPTIEVLAGICLRYRVSPEYLLIGTGSIFADIPASDTIKKPKVTQAKTKIAQKQQ